MQDINYDEVLVNSVITITIKGKAYQVQEPSLEAILKFEEASAKLVDIKEIKDVAAQVIKIIRTVYINVPSEAFDGLSPKFLYKILFDIKKMVQDSMLPEFVDAQKVTGDDQPPKKKLTTKN